MKYIKLTKCNAQVVKMQNTAIGIIDLENKIAYLPTSNILMSKTKNIGTTKVNDIVYGFINLVNSLKNQKTSIVYYQNEIHKNHRKVYEIM